MTLALLLNIVASGLLTGLVYGLAALGLSVIFGVVRVVNFAHGEMMVAGMYGAVLLFGALGLDPILSAPLVAAVLFVFGWALQRGLVNKFVERPEHMQFILLLGIATIVLNLLLMVFGPDSRGVMVPYVFDVFEIGPFHQDATRTYAGLGAIAVAAVLFAFFRFSRTGKAIRACADNPLGARVVGLNIDGLYALTFGIGAAVVGIAGALLTLVVEARPQLAPEYTLLSFIIVIVGGLGSLPGALLGGVLIGVSEALAGFLLMPSLKALFSYVVLIVVLLLRPQGLLGRRS
ncbi:branched-chain amino acid ABC transporter permease [Azospirillum sp. TSO22-1]|uniref:branched-chain amino acid ABC transporter permease n=1 Tax=Azospirillum sp. TSO22-1 TaxID=716789 RepID=UPI000D60EAB9|nr:branched-chain amino acid ABC transporter permease [Azospirillum sp. TSO22-1]PWC42809.1 branched-chain amino acid ABC transporter [Azospirillum sp. TSO22-1]